MMPEQAPSKNGGRIVGGLSLSRGQLADTSGFALKALQPQQDVVDLRCAFAVIVVERWPVGHAIRCSAEGSFNLCTSEHFPLMRQII